MSFNWKITKPTDDRNVETRKVLFEKTEKIKSILIESSTRMLRAHWTPELAQDLEAYHSIDAEAELIALLSKEITFHSEHNLTRNVIVEKFKDVENWGLNVWTNSFISNFYHIH